MVSFETIVDIANDLPLKIVLGYFVVNGITYGIRRIFGGFWLEKVELKSLKSASFYTACRNTLDSEKLTRIVQWKFFSGAKLPGEVRNEILEKYGPQQGRIFSHYKDVIKK